MNVTIDGTSFELFTDGEWAWPGSAEDDAALLAALKNGTTAVLTARSGRGTQTKDTFSLARLHRRDGRSRKALQVSARPDARRPAPPAGRFSLRAVSLSPRIPYIAAI